MSHVRTNPRCIIWSDQEQKVLWALPRTATEMTRADLDATLAHLAGKRPGERLVLIECGEPIAQAEMPAPMACVERLD